MANDKRKKELSHLQELAVRQLAQGKNLAAAARAVGVSRQTVYNWMSQPGFVAAMNRWRESAVTLAQGQILAGLTDAAATVVSAAREGDARIAMTLLEKSGAFAPLARHPTDPEQIAREQALAKRADNAALAHAELDLLEAEELNLLRQVHNAPPSPIRVPPSPPKEKSAKPAPPAPPPAGTAPNSPEARPVPQAALAKRPPSPSQPVYIPDPELVLQRWHS